MDVTNRLMVGTSHSNHSIASLSKDQSIWTATAKATPENNGLIG